MLSIKFSSASDIDGSAALWTPACFRACGEAGMFLLQGALLVAELAMVLGALTDPTGGDAEKRPKISSSTLEAAVVALDGTLMRPLLLLLLTSLCTSESESNSALGYGFRGGLGLPARSVERGTEEAV